MTSCTTGQPVGELGNLARRLLALEAWWRPESVVSIREALAEAAALPERQARAQEALRAAEDVRARLTPDSTRTTQALWREEQAAVTRLRSEVVRLRQEEMALLSTLEVELWWARTAKWQCGVAALNAQERDAG